MALWSAIVRPRLYAAVCSAAAMSVTWMILLMSSTGSETLTTFPINFFALVWSSS